MAFDLNPVAVTSASLLRAIAAGGFSTLVELAGLAGRDPKNMSRDLATVRNSGLVDPSEIVLTDDGRDQLAALDRAANTDLAAEGGDPANLSLRHADILPDPDNARRDWTSDDAVADLAALANDIRDNGLLQNLIVRPHPDPLIDEWILVGGERRWRALGLLIERGEWLAEQTVPARRLNTDDLGIRLAALAENLQRRALNPIEEANAYRGLREAGLTTEQIAERVTMTQRHVQGRLQLLDLLSEDQQRRMTLPADDKDRLSVSDARKLVQNAEAKQKAREKAEAELSARARLIFAEMRLATGEGYIFARIQVDGLVMSVDEDAVALEKAGLIKAPTTWTNDGKTEARCDDKAWELGQALFPEGATPYAAALRTELGLPEPAEGQWSTPWMNGPFEVPEPIAADLAARHAARAQEDEEREAQIQANIRAREAAVQRHALSRVHAEALLTKAAAAPAAPILDDVPQLAASLDRRLPWAATEKGQVLDADGSQVMTFCAQWQSAGDREIALAMLTATAVNTAAGIETPPLIVAEAEQAADGSDPDADEADEGGDEEDD